MRRQIKAFLPDAGTMKAGIYRQSYAPPVLAMLSMQPVDGGSSFREYLTGRKVSDYMEAIGEIDLPSTDEEKEGEARRGALVLCGGLYYEVVQRQAWLNGVINHYEYLLFSVTDREAKARIGG